jgi:ribosomal protection tetracycline resistance protein
MPSLNLAIVAHVDAGKTSLTERLLFEAGAIDALGSVDDGTTRTDSMDLERRRGITIRAAVTSFELAELAVNLIDTPGHPDFIAEVERSLTVLDAAVLVVSAVEGVQPQTVVLWRALRRLGVPCAVFINKIDRAGADPIRVTHELTTRLDHAFVALSQATQVGTHDAQVVGIDLQADPVVRREVERGTVTPLVHGSAITGAGVSEVQRVVSRVLPRPRSETGPLAATVFAVDRDERGRRAWLRMWRGELHVRDRIAVGTARPERVTELGISRAGGVRTEAVARPGEIVLVRGPSAWRVGDTIGVVPPRAIRPFAPPTLQTVVEPVDPAQRGALFAALTELADEDPLIDLRLDEDDCALSLHGEVQKEVIGALLDQRFGVAARFRGTRTVCIERVVGTGSALDEISVADNPYLATIGLRIDAAPVGHGIEFSPGIERGHLPPAFIAATEEGVRGALLQGRFGWAVTDCVVTMTASHYAPRQSHAHQKFNKAMSSVGADFRHLAPVVVTAALDQARTRVCEPVDRYELEFPERLVNALSALLGRLGATTSESATGNGWTRYRGHVRSARVAELASRLPDLTGGEAILQTEFDHYAPVTDSAPPARPRTGADPRNRQEWFRAMPR